MSMFDRQEWVNAVEDLKAKAREFVGLVDRVTHSVPQTPELTEKRQAVLSRANVIKGTIERTTQAIDWTYAQWRDWFGNDADNTLQGLGLIPLIPIAAIAAAAGSVTYGIKQLKDYMQENDRIKDLRAEGYTTPQAVEIMRGQDTGIGPSIERGIKTIGPWIAAGVAIWVISQRKFKL